LLGYRCKKGADKNGYRPDLQTDLSTAANDFVAHDLQDKIRKTAPPALLALVPSSRKTSQINGKTESAKTAEIKASFSTE
jgi:hypothetical protein